MDEALAILVLDAPIVPAGDVVSLGAPSVAWVPRGHDVRAGATGDDDDWAFVGWGAAATITGTGPDRFAQIRAAADRLWARLSPASATDIPLPFSPRLFGGFAFDAARAESARGESARGESDGLDVARGVELTDRGAGLDAHPRSRARGFAPAREPAPPKSLAALATGGGVTPALRGVKERPGETPEPGAGPELGAGRESNIALAWRAFGDAAFVLPETLYSYSNERTAAAGGRSPDAAGAAAAGGRSPDAAGTAAAGGRSPDAAGTAAAGGRSPDAAGAFLVAFVPEAEIPAARGRLEALRRSLEGLVVPPASTATVRVQRRDAVSRLRARRTEKARGAPYEVGAPPVESVVDPTERAYVDMVARALREIERGAFQKVVLCRARRIDLPSSGDPNTASPGSAASAFAHLDARHTSCSRFFFAHGSSRFLGATPERLVLVRGRRVVTEALAGTLPRHPGEAEGDARQELLASTKDRAEHAFVVAAIRESLAPACEALSIPDVPVVRSLPHVHHLATPIAGLLARSTHALDVAARLHPTPALCGSPKPQARAFLLAHEAQPRGWYGGGVGWFDRDGDGSFGVAIRSAIVAVREGQSGDVVAAREGQSGDVVAVREGQSGDVVAAREGQSGDVAAAREGGSPNNGSLEAWIYAGAGVVRGSDPDRELAETITKERAMREALEVAFWPPAEPETLDDSATSVPNNPASSAVALNSPAPSSSLSGPVVPLAPDSPEAA